MKKILFALSAVALLFATSCKKESVNPAVDVPEGSFLATIDNGANPQNAPVVKDGMGTMTTIDANRYVIWETGDEISINGSTYTTDASGSSVIFSGGNATGSTFHAFFPASIAGTDAAGSLPATQTIVLDGNNNITVRNLPMYATSTNNQLTFKNICAALKITIPSFLNGATSIEVSSSDKAMNGAFTVTDNAAVMTATTPTDAEKKITVQKSSGTFATNEVVYIAVPANTYGNFKVEFFNNTTSMWNKTLTSWTFRVNKVYTVNVTPSDIPVNCFHFTALAATDISMVKDEEYMSTPDLSLEYCKYTASDQSYSAWNTFISPSHNAETVSLAAGDKLYFKAASVGNTSFAGEWTYRYFTSTGNVEVSGNIMYLLSETPSTTFPSGSTRTFEKIFHEMTTLISAENLELPATTLVNECYYGLFSGCSSLTAAPALPATTLADDCYGMMFNYCSALVNAPVLPATTLPTNCYRYMFSGCSSISEVTMLANTIGNNALQYWLSDAGTGAKKVYIDNDVYDNQTGTSQAIYNTINSNLGVGWTIDKVANKPQ